MNEVKEQEIIKEIKSWTELQYDLKVKCFWVGETKCYPASVLTDVMNKMQDAFQHDLLMIIKREREQAKNWWKFWRKWK